MSEVEAADVSLAQQAYSLGHYARAETLCKRVLEHAPEEFRAMFLLGKALSAQGHPWEAKRWLEKAASHESDNIDCLNWLAMVQRNVGSHAESLETARIASTLDPASATAHFNIAMALLANEQWRPAINSFLKAVELNPRVANYDYHLAATFEKLGCLADAEDAYSAALRKEPNFKEALLALAELNIRQRKWVESEARLRQLLPLAKKSGRVNMLLGLSLANLARTDEAELFLRTAIELEPGLIRAQEILAFLYQSVGQNEAALEMLERVLERTPSRGSTFLLFAHFKKCSDLDRPLLEKMERQAQQNTPQQSWQMHFGLGKAYDDLGEYESAMRSFDKAHDILASLQADSFSRAEYARIGDDLIAMFDREFLDLNHGRGAESNTPIFIVGAVRSGTTLLEQMLSRHCEIGTSGEQSFWPLNAEGAYRHADKSLSVEAGPLSNEYLRILRMFEPDKQHVIDKNPTNIALVGLLYCLFPKARILHIRRNPLDTCLSIYMTPGASQISWTHHKDDIAFVYERYQALCNHWRNLIPRDSYIEVQYENLVLNAEPELRRILDFCQLEWDGDCLQPHLGGISVSPSLAQIRKPIHSNSIDRWKNYEPWLGELRKLLMVRKEEVVE